MAALFPPSNYARGGEKYRGGGKLIAILPSLRTGAEEQLCHRKGTVPSPSGEIMNRAEVRLEICNVHSLD